MKSITTDELIQKLQTRDTVVFGTGFVAEMFYQALIQHGLADRVRAYTVTEARAGQRFHGIPVLSFRETAFPGDTLLCVAVHESALAGIEAALEIASAEVVDIYSNLYDMLYGNPIMSTSLPLAAILQSQDPDEYWLALRFAAIRDYLTRPDRYKRTKDLYLRALSLHCKEETAVRRCGQMEKLADSMARGGFRENCPLRIDESFRIIDGLHRAACAAFLKIARIPVLIYPLSSNYDILLGEKNRLAGQTLLDAGFCADEIDFLRAAQKELSALTGPDELPQQVVRSKE